MDQQDLCATQCDPSTSCVTSNCTEHSMDALATPEWHTTHIRILLLQKLTMTYEEVSMEDIGLRVMISKTQLDR